MKAKYLSLIVLFLYSVFSLHAATRCEAPAPSSASVNHQEPTSTTISWASVRSARSYQVVVSELHSGRVHETVRFRSQTTYTVTGQTPGVAYLYEISASFCNQGPYGARVSVMAGGTVVDIILGLTTEGNGLIIEDVALADFTYNLDFSVNYPSCYVVHGETTALSPNVTFDFALRGGGTSSTELVGLSSNPWNFYLDGYNPVYGRLSDGSFNGTPTGPFTSLFDLTADNFQYGPDVAFRTHTAMNLTITLYDYCQFIDGSLDLQGHNDVPNPEEQAIEVYPKPAEDLLQVRIPEAGKVEIWDLTGRRWYSHEAAASVAKQDVDVQAWPAGTYMLRWYPPNNQEPVVQYFLKH